MFGRFEGKVVCGDDAKYKMKGKPEPDIFLAAAREMLGKDVGEPGGLLSDEQKEERARGLVFEDGLPGMQAGKRAGMSGSIYSPLSGKTRSLKSSDMGSRCQPSRR